MEKNKLSMNNACCENGNKERDIDIIIRNFQEANENYSKLLYELNKKVNNIVGQELEENCNKECDMEPAPISVVDKLFNEISIYNKNTALLEKTIFHLDKFI